MKNDQTTTVSLRPERVPNTAIDAASVLLSYHNPITTTTRRYIILATDGVP